MIILIRTRRFNLEKLENEEKNRITFKSKTQFTKERIKSLFQHEKNRISLCLGFNPKRRIR